ncbi:MAG: hypothetical protein OXF06_07375 [Bacteroidetes bacterium]|nr:hypothetical protein [Bacteroidota bacterium]
MPLFMCCGETGDVRRAGTQRVVTKLLDVIIPIKEQAKEHVTDRVIFRLDAGFNGGMLYENLECNGLF